MNAAAVHPIHSQPVLPQPAQPQFRVPAPPGPHPNQVSVVSGASHPARFVVPQKPQPQVQQIQPAARLPSQSHVIQQQVRSSALLSA